jgi:hypothetical protein
MYDQAVAEYLTDLGLEGFPPESGMMIKDTYAKSGWKAFVQAGLNLTVEKSKTSRIRPIGMAEIYARLGQKDEQLHGWSGHTTNGTPDCCL